MFSKCRRYQIIIYCIISFFVGMLITFFLPAYAVFMIVVLLVAAIVWLFGSFNKF